MSSLYADAAAVLGPSLQQQQQRKNGGKSSSSLKTRTYSDNIRNKKLTHLLVSETLKHRSALELIMERCRMQPRELCPRTPALVYVYLYELLFGRSKRILGGGSLKKQILEQQSELEQAKTVVLNKHPELVPVAHKLTSGMPRYVRVNTIKTTPEQVQAAFPQATADEHVPLLLHLPSNTDLHDHALARAGHVILQDKSSCFPVAALATELKRRDMLVQFDAIDCCAAPGNKTTQLCALLAPHGGRVFAFDKSPARHALLESRMKLAGADANGTCVCGDFLEQRAEDARFERVRCILLDPSCSGSGSFSVERASEAKMKETDERVTRLADFQLEILLHAMSFSQVEVISYSTCSILFPENELVCQRALTSSDEWELVEALPQWPRRGVVQPGGLDAAQAKLVVRADYTLGDATGGFFLALFVRRRKQETSTTQTTTKKKKRTVLRNLLDKRALLRRRMDL